MKKLVRLDLEEEIIHFDMENSYKFRKEWKQKVKDTILMLPNLIHLTLP